MILVRAFLRDETTQPFREGLPRVAVSVWESDNEKDRMTFQVHIDFGDARDQPHTHT